MEPRQNEQKVSNNANPTTRKRSVVSPMISLPNRLPETNKNTAIDLPVADVPTRSLEEDTQRPQHTTGMSPAAPRLSLPTHVQTLVTPPQPVNRGRDTSPPSYGGQEIPVVRPSARAKKEEQFPQKLVRVLPVKGGSPGYPRSSPFAQPTGSFRWEQQTSRYPAELLELMQAETQMLQAVVVPSSKTSAAPAVAPAKPKVKFRKRRRVPEMRQVTAVECGAVCLAMILNYYGYATSTSEVQERCGVGRDGLTALEIVKSARLYGLRVRAVSLNLEDFRYVTLPAIVHWEFNHFLIVERWSSREIEVLDPAVGRRKLTPEEFDEGFTGVTLMLEPGTQFETKSPQKALTAWAYMRSLLHMRGILFQIISTSLLLQLLGLGAPLLTEVVVDRILPEKDPNMLTLLAVGMLILIAMQGIAGFLRSTLLIYLQTRIDTDMMLNFFEHLLSLPYRFFQLRLNGDLLARVNSNQAIRDLLTNQLISTLLDGGTVIVYLVILLFLSKLIAVTTLAIGAVQVFLLLVTSPAIRKMTQRDLEARGKTQGYMNEILSGIVTLKAAGAEQRAFSRWENLFFDEMNISLRLSYLSLVISTMLGIVSLLSPLLLLWIGAKLVIAGTMSVGTMLALDTLAAQLLGPLGSLATSAQDVQIVRAHFSRIADVIGTQPEQDATQAYTPHRLRGGIDLRHVSFSYDQNTPPILKDVNIKIYPGQKIALVGKTGSGKSTLGKLLVGLITPTKGSILFDNMPLDQLNYQEIRSQFGVVMQESFIFSGSVWENITLNNPDMNMEQIVEAARMAAIDEDIEKMPMGYDTLVSEGGSALSGGQRQRLSLARALAHHPALLLLDEATSALDVVTERTVERNLRRLPCTQIIIAHRLSTIRNADVILVLDRGHIVEKGSHEQLLRNNGFYKQLIQTQLQNGEIAAR
jgi:ATP-binding cassette, subfamily B, bacterial